MSIPSADPPFDRWGRLSRPVESRGAYLRIEDDSAKGWKTTPPGDAVRIWHRMPGEPDDDDRSNWTIWLHRPDLAGWMANYVVDEWLPEGVEPPWDQPPE